MPHVFIHRSPLIAMIFENYKMLRIDGHRHYHTEVSKSDRERQISHGIVYMRYPKRKGRAQMNLFTNQNRVTDVKTNLWSVTREWGDNKLRDWD